MGPPDGAVKLHNASSCLSAHWHRVTNSRPLSTHLRPAAVCVLGQTRLFGLTVFNLYWSLHLHSLPHHLFFVGPADRSWRLHEAFIANDLPSTVFRYRDPVRVFHDESRPAWWLQNETDRAAARRATAHRVLMLNSATAGGLGMRASDGRVQQRFVAMMAQLWQQNHCLRMVRAYEAAHGMCFSRCRS